MTKIFDKIAERLEEYEIFRDETFTNCLKLRYNLGDESLFCTATVNKAANEKYDICFVEETRRNHYKTKTHRNIPEKEILATLVLFML